MQEPIAYTPVREHTETPSPWMEPRALIWLNLASFGLYFYVWFYRNWKHFAPLWPQARPLLRTIGLFLPLLDLWLIWDFVKRVRAELAAQHLSFVSPWPLLGLMVWLALNWAMPSEGWLFLVSMGFSFVAALWGGFCLRTMQQRLNLYWESRDPALVLPGLRWFLGERVSVVLGAFVWLSILFGLVGQIWLDSLKS